MFSIILNLFKNTWYSIMNFLGFGNKSIGASEALQIFVRTNVGEQVCVALQPSWTVQRVKQDLALKLKTSEDQLKIIFAGKELPNELTFEDCDIGNRSILHAVRAEARTLGTQNLQRVEEEPTVCKQKTHKDPCVESINLPAEHKPQAIASSQRTSGEMKREKMRPLNMRLLCDASTVMTIQLSEEELRELNKLKASEGGTLRPHFYVYCAHPCASVCVGKLRVRCSECRSGAITVHRDPASWNDVLQTNQITASCENPECSGSYAEFFFKCREHETSGEDDTAIVLYLIRSNLPGVPCLACLDVSSPIVVFQCASAHVMCLDCFVTYCISLLNERQFVCDTVHGYTLPCPVKCPNSLIEEVHHFKLMGEQNYERYQRFGTEEALLAAGGVLCPYPGCGQGILPDEDCRRVKCVGGCEFVFCKDCLQGYHIGECTQAYNESDTEEPGIERMIDPNRADLSSWDKASSVTIRVISKPCPQCRTPTERSGGCMHMVCTRASCQFNWCWVCQIEWTRECMAAHWFG